MYSRLTIIGGALVASPAAYLTDADSASHRRPRRHPPRRGMTGFDDRWRQGLDLVFCQVDDGVSGYLAHEKGECEYGYLCFPDPLDRAGHQALQGHDEAPGGFHQARREQGREVREAVYTVGEYDIVIVSEFPDDETATAALLQVGAIGNVRTNTMGAFAADEMGGIISRVG